MSDKPRCLTCLYRLPDERPEFPNDGHCRRYPPQLSVWTVTGHDLPSQPGFEQHFPWMRGDQWCGEWKGKP